MFGRQLKTSGGGGAGPPGKPGVGFKTTADGHYNLDSKRLCNVGDAKEPGDAVTLDVLTFRLNSLAQSINHSMNEKYQSNVIALESRLRANIKKLHEELMDMKTAIGDLRSDIRLLQDIGNYGKRRRS